MRDMTQPEQTLAQRKVGPKEIQRKGEITIIKAIIK